ncbi:MAG: hypothetical protein AB7F41_07065 [Methylocystis sp.]|uniref:hypothetical protein n=1 Tax=Methylocystis sp. TaxID=1911079 RepID=UPI003D0FACD1
MEELTKNIIDETKLDPTVARAAIGLVLLFLRDEDKTGNVATMIGKLPGSERDIEAAQSVGDGGVTQVIEGFTSLVGRGRADVNILAGQLEKLGVSEAQTDVLVQHVVKRAEKLLGPEGAEKIMNIMQSLRERTDTATDLRKQA